MSVTNYRPPRHGRNTRSTGRDQGTGDALSRHEDSCAHPG